MEKQGLYDPANEHDSCGVGFIANINGEKTHKIVTDGITILKNLVHRGAVGGDLKTGDGAGILIQMPHDFFQNKGRELNFELPDNGQYGVGVIFLPSEKNKRKIAISIIEKKVKEEGGKILACREVPVTPDCLGEIARASLPFIIQVFITFDQSDTNQLERKLYITRRVIEIEALKQGFSLEEFYICSFSNKTLVYKGMFVAPQFAQFYPDLNDKSIKSAICLVHQRYSTNTFPSWPLAQPFRTLAHNGEINTLRGNVNKMRAREMILSSEVFGKDVRKIIPLLNTECSDSAIFDNVFELLCMAGRSVEHAMMMMVPEAFGVKYHISEDKRAFYHYHAAVMEPWDGPAALAFTDGVKVGATLDRNGLRPIRYVISKTGSIVLASEVGVLTFPPEDVLQKGRLGPGKMLLVDTLKKRVIFDNEIKSSVSRNKQYRRWMENNIISLKGLFQAPRPVTVKKTSLPLKQKAFAYTIEEIDMIIKPMVQNAQEPIGSMGNDAALAVLSDKPQLLYNYFKQLFAQVTNPPIDPYRESLVMSLMSFIGREKNLLEESPEHCRQLKLPHPILTNEDMELLRNVDLAEFKSAVIPIFFEKLESAHNLRQAIKNVCHTVEKKIDQGASLIILSDRDINEKYIPIPALLIVSAVHQYLIDRGKRQLAGLIIETGEVRDVMHFATLIGYGASAINPYLLFETVADLIEKDFNSKHLKLEKGIENYITAIKKGLLKIMSKMGVSTIRSYRGAQIFEAVGLNRDLVDEYFPGTPSRIEGIDLNIIAQESIRRHDEAYAAYSGGYGKEDGDNSTLNIGGNIHFRSFSEKHYLTPEAITLVQKAARNNDYTLYKKYTEQINNIENNLCTLRGLFQLKKSKPVPIDEVEPVEEIVKRFATCAMSFGSISKEAHETMAIAMNRLQAASNSGEGGEDEERYIPLANGDLKKSMIKQVASGRFGVNSNYLANAKELQIKMAQGAKPGEGGQLPGHKVNDIIAKVRYSTPGVMLISPPPHHDIYSIEDLAQLIFDLKNSNPDARVSVKLVSEVGVGTVAAGVAKGKADMVLISGHDGGTGASPISSIKYAGIPWEIGLAETQQTLVLNKLRDKIRVQVDGQLRTGRDIVIGALLGAEEYGFGTIALVIMGCIMMRKCHLNTCPVGIATQNEELRKRFTGKADYIVNFMRFIAQDAREIMAELGFRTIDEMVGQSDRLEINKAIDHWKAKGLDFTNVFAKPKLKDQVSAYCTKKQLHDFSLSLDTELVNKFQQIIKENNKDKKINKIEMPIRNCHRTVGATLSYNISKQHDSKGLAEDSIWVNFNGSAGQSFGAFLAPGVTFELSGDTNDYFAKGLSGGKIIVYPPKGSTFRPQNNIITGNVNLFGASRGQVFINGMAGERFAVRNSGATAVVEGVGDHGCEYMTGGVVVVLGKTGINFAAGMSGGIAYVLDEDQLFDTKCNLEMVDIEFVVDDNDKELLYRLIEQHIEYTHSEYASRILRDWTEMAPLFVKVMPIDYRKALQRMAKQVSRETDAMTITEEVYK